MGEVSGLLKQVRIRAWIAETLTRNISSSQHRATSMLHPFLIFFALLSGDRSADQAPVGCRQVPAASPCLVPADDRGGGHCRREASEQGLQDGGEEDGLPCYPGRPIEDEGPPADLINSQQSPLHPSSQSRHRPLRAPPAP